MRLRSNPVPRIRLEDGPTAIRPSSPDDLTDLVTLRVANRAHTGPWEPVRDASFYTAAGQRLELDLDARAWASGSAYPFSVLDAGDGDGDGDLPPGVQARVRLNEDIALVPDLAMIETMIDDAIRQTA